MATSKTDQLVLDLLKKVEEKKQQIGKAERPSWETNCSFGFDPTNNTRINIQVVRDLEELVNIYGFIQSKYTAFNVAARDLNLLDDNTEPVFKWQGFTFHQWSSDIKTRISQLKIKNKRDELEKLQERVNSLVSPEQRRQIELEKLVKELS